MHRAKKHSHFRGGITIPCLRVTEKGRTGSMPRQGTYHGRATYALPDDSPERLKRFKQAVQGGGGAFVVGDCPTRRDPSPPTIRRWRDQGVRPALRHQGSLILGGRSAGGRLQTFVISRAVAPCCCGTGPSEPISPRRIFWWKAGRPTVHVGRQS